MEHSARNNWFTTARRAAEAACFYAVVVLIALAIGFAASVMALTAPKRGGMLGASLPAVAWDLPR